MGSSLELVGCFERKLKGMHAAICFGHPYFDAHTHTHLSGNDVLVGKHLKSGGISSRLIFAQNSLLSLWSEFSAHGYP